MFVQGSSYWQMLPRTCSASGLKWLVSIGIYVCGPKQFFNSTLAIDSPFSYNRGRTSRQIYRPALPLLSPVTISSSSKSRIFLYNAHLALSICLDGWHNYPHKRIGKYCSKLELALEVRALTIAVCRTRQQADLLQTGKEWNMRELRFRRGSPLACGVMGIVSSNPFTVHFKFYANNNSV